MERKIMTKISRCPVRRTVAAFVAFAMFELSFLPLSSTSHAGMVTTASVVADLNRVENKQTIDQFLERSDVKEQLLKAGVTSEEASMRLAALSDFEVKNLASQIDANRVGGDVIVIGLGTVLLVVLILILVRRI